MRTALAATLCIFSVLACDDPKSGGPTAPSASATAAAAPTPSAAPPPSATASAPSAPLPKCPAGLTPNAVPAYCIKLPDAYKVKEARVTPKKGAIEYDTGTTTDNLTITFDDTTVAELAKQTEGEMKFGGDKLDKKGDLPGGNKWFQGTHADYQRIVTLIKAQAPFTLKCSFAYQPAKAPPKDAVEACKSIVIPAP